MPLDTQRAFRPVRIAALTVSDTRTRATDRSGDVLEELITGDGHHLAARAIVKDDAPAIAARLRQWVEDPAVEAVVSTGGTGLTGRDVTPEALASLGGRDIPGFGEMFRALSWPKIGASAIQSRAAAAVVNSTYIFALPGSVGACRDGWEGILRHQLDIRWRPCNFVELMPRLEEV